MEFETKSINFFPSFYFFRDFGTELKESANGLKIYRPNFRRIVEDKQDKIRSYTLGDKNPMKAMKYIMMVGMTGAGKSLQG